jgi:hypothetical protein
VLRESGAGKRWSRVAPTLRVSADTGYNLHPEEGLMNRRAMIGGMMAAMATPAMLQAQGIGGWAASVRPPTYQV